jgi:hypothetical protein
VQRGRVVLMDTNIIIEAFRTRSWNAITSYFAVEAPEKCYEEALTGNLHRRGYVEVDATLLRKGLSVRHAVSDTARAALALKLRKADALDAGERDLLAHALERTDAWLASCADRAAMFAALELGWEERFISLEAMARAAGAKPSLKSHFTDGWLSEVRTAYKLDRSLD